MGNPATATAPAGDTSAEALRLLEEVAKKAPKGYVALQTIPYRAHHLLVTEALSVTSPGARVFEGGVSAGYLARVLVRAGRSVDGAELDPVEAAKAEEVCDRVLVGDLSQLDLGTLRDDYDLLLFGDTLEHLPAPEEVLRRLAARTVEGGHLVLSIPNIANWSIRLMLLAGRFRYTDRGIMDRTHLRFYTVATLPEMLRDAGFEVLRLQASVPVPGVTAERACALAHRFGNLAPGLFGYNLVATCRRLPGAASGS